MAIQKTYLMVAPSGQSDLLGSGLLGTEIVRGLRRLNPQIRAWEQHPDYHWYPGRDAGKSCLWIGEPGGASEKISSFLWGMNPEFTQLDPDGNIIEKGWRAIFEKVIKTGAATRAAIEREFRVSLVVVGKDELCGACVKTGKRRKHNGGVLHLCRLHENVYRAARDLIDRQRTRQENPSVNV